MFSPKISSLSSSCREQGQSVPTADPIEIASANICLLSVSGRPAAATSLLARAWSRARSCFGLPPFVTVSQMDWRPSTQGVLRMTCLMLEGWQLGVVGTIAPGSFFVGPDPRGT
jgi:hypothetical protein